MAKKKDRPADPVERERARVLEACERLGSEIGRASCRERVSSVV